MRNIQYGSVSGRGVSKASRFSQFISRKSSLLLVLILGIGILAGCKQTTNTSSAADQSSKTALAELQTPPHNRLEMRIDGKPWRADREFFAAIHPPGMEGGVVISGSFGPKDRNEQVFSLIVQGVNAPGNYRVDSSHPDGSVAQIANLSPDRFLIGNIQGFDMTVAVEKFNAAPLALELRFSGRLTDNKGHPAEITEGRFSYLE